MNLLHLLDRPIAFHRCLVGPAGGINAALLLGQALYWTKRTSDPEGWFWKTQKEWEEETGLTRYEQEAARAALRKRGFLSEELRGLPARLFFHVNLETLREALADGHADKDAGNPQTGGSVPNCNGDKDGVLPHTGEGVSRIQVGGFPASIHSETTSETTPRGSEPRAGARETPPPAAGNGRGTAEPEPQHYPAPGGAPPGRSLRRGPKLTAAEKLAALRQAFAAQDAERDGRRGDDDRRVDRRRAGPAPG